MCWFILFIHYGLYKVGFWCKKNNFSNKEIIMVDTKSIILDFPYSLCTIRPRAACHQFYGQFHTTSRSTLTLAWLIRKTCLTSKQHSHLTQNPGPNNYHSQLRWLVKNPRMKVLFLLRFFFKVKKNSFHLGWRESLVSNRRHGQGKIRQNGLFKLCWLSVLAE